MSMQTNRPGDRRAMLEKNYEYASSRCLSDESAKSHQAGDAERTFASTTDLKTTADSQNLVIRFLRSARLLTRLSKFADDASDMFTDGKMCK